MVKQWIGRLQQAQAPLVRALGAMLSFAALAVVIIELRDQGMAPIGTLIKSGLAFWIMFLTSLMVEPVAEFAILRRLLGAGGDVFPALIRKQALNNLLFGYAGDTYLAAWLQQHIGDARRAFAVVCDLAIVSALVNNIATLLLLAIVWQPIQALAGVRFDGWAMVVAFGLVALPLLLMAWRRVRTQDGRMGTILAFLTGRTVVATALVALTWHFAMPEVPLISWTLLMAARMVVSRLPIVPNKDLAFAGIVTLFMGADDRIAPMIAGVALLSLLAQGLAMVLLWIAQRLSRPALAQNVAG